MPRLQKASIAGCLGGSLCREEPKIQWAQRLKFACPLEEVQPKLGAWLISSGRFELWREAFSLSMKVAASHDDDSFKCMYQHIDKMIEAFPDSKKEKPVLLVGAGDRRLALQS